MSIQFGKGQSTAEELLEEWKSLTIFWLFIIPVGLLIHTFGKATGIDLLRKYR